MTKEQAIAATIEEAFKEFTTSAVVKQLRLKYTDAYIREEVLPYCMKGIRLAILEVIR